MCETIYKTQYPDSIEIGTPKNGVLKVYFNADDEETAKKRLDVAKRLLASARGENYGLDKPSE